MPISACILTLSLLFTIFNTCDASNAPTPEIAEVTPTTANVSVPQFLGTKGLLRLPLGNFPAATSSFTIEIWFYPTNAKGVLLFAEHSVLKNFIYLALAGSQVLYRFGTHVTTYAYITSDNTVALNKWHRVIISQDRTQGNLSVDGQTYAASLPRPCFEGVNLEKAEVSLGMIDTIFPYQVTQNGGIIDPFQGAILKVKTSATTSYSWWESNLITSGVGEDLGSIQQFSGYPCAPNPCPNNQLCLPRVTNNTVQQYCMSPNAPAQPANNATTAITTSAPKIVTTTAVSATVSTTKRALNMQMSPASLPTPSLEEGMLKDNALLELIVEEAIASCSVTAQCLLDVYKIHGPIQTIQDMPGLDGTWTVKSSSLHVNPKTFGVDLNLGSVAVILSSPLVILSSNNHLSVSLRYRAVSGNIVQFLIQGYVNANEAVILFGDLIPVETPGQPNFMCANFSVTTPVNRVDLIFINDDTTELAPPPSTDGDKFTTHDLKGSNFIQLMDLIIFNDSSDAIAPPQPPKLNLGLLKKHANELGETTWKALIGAANRFKNALGNVLSDLMSVLLTVFDAGATKTGLKSCADGAITARLFIIILVVASVLFCH